MVVGIVITFVAPFLFSVAVGNIAAANVVISNFGSFAAKIMVRITVNLNAGNC